MPLWINFPHSREEVQERYDFLSDEDTHTAALLLAAGITEVALWIYPPTRPVAMLPGVSLGTWIAIHEAGHWFYDRMFFSRGGGGPSAQSQPPPTSSKIRRQARASAQGGKSGGPGRASHQGSRPRRESCPKGQYWSFKQKKCVKSKFR